ncbi:3-hydroxyacyl-CoA dehydrogenase NAD-binding domain-containing protein [Oharaeibacter diazotrophicus]|uniref:enoyl-CoA hydratase n=1 Tax=Oharaeibacter diazotrophicus TaxID=1920512 RepID=A0A4R6RA87_9HYPH|nr:3-hydroxyacyl-CoA dehydrogenase NAD-binding domain-containing protein [Oharaeibacter diazotrophicus]TDP82556.1 3-hydroxyacyl-CoA dehydrogenase [Oharaeibacter diazotrophicus]BBE72680.1 fatty acid oxidation complex subunit alpha [Pleomorphomonas sp. SM30]GLS76715.1 3-hydroxyacyl-CoA dehydrogenase [Oharaeibacter diazotrophicus]
MTYTHFTVETDADGVALVTWNSPDRSMNVFTEAVLRELAAIVEAVTADAAVEGVVVTSGKPGSFSGGADLKMLEGLLKAFHARKGADPEGAAKALLADVSAMGALFRRIETSGKPWVAAINGTCMGGAFELALACHARVAVDDEGVKMGLPEVKVGIFPGAGGTQRVMRMTDAQGGLTFLLQGQTPGPKKALAQKLIDKVVPAAELVETAKAMIRAGLDPKKPWDKDGFKAPAGKVQSPQGFQFWPAANAIYRRETFDNYPAARAILKVCHDGLQLPMDLALRVEARHFAHVLTTKEAAAMIRSLFVSMQELNKGARRPAGAPATKLRKVGVIGAGFMGAGIAYVSAAAGLDVVLIDQSLEAAEKGRAHSDKLISDRVAKGRAKPADREALLARITATDDYAALAGCDLVVEAVFEDRAVKEAAMAKARAVLPAGAVFASNTSTLPISSLAPNWHAEADFVGIHFFSPVDKMMLVEVIRGRNTGDAAVALALDFVKAIRKTPIVVNDSRGFYANRCVTNYMLEAHLLLTEGVPPAMVETVARMAGMPVGPLSLNDEVAVDLAWKILQAAKKDLGDAAVDPRQEKLLHGMVVERGRLGRKNGKGFYDYPAEKGAKKTLWKGIAEIVGAPKPAEAFDVAELKHRLLAVQALEAARCVEEGVVTDVREADVGSILGFGFAPFTGGTLSWIDGMGAAAFVALCDDLAARHGARFAPPALLREMAEKGETFYGRFAPPAADKAAA